MKFQLSFRTPLRRCETLQGSSDIGLLGARKVAEERSLRRVSHHLQSLCVEYSWNCGGGYASPYPVTTVRDPKPRDAMYISGIHRVKARRYSRAFSAWHQPVHKESSERETEFRGKKRAIRSTMYGD